MGDQSPNPTGPMQPAADQRAYRRLPTHGVRSLLGYVMDISPGGMRVRHQGAGGFNENEAFDVVVWHGQRDLLATVRVVWTAEIGSDEWDIGLEFVGETQALRQRVVELAERGCGQFGGPQCWLAA
jgi:hypothetical protein